jgi:hypothetical protein
MATYQIPDNAGQCRVVIAKAGNPLVTNDKTGKNKILIACKTHDQANEICDQINNGDHNGTINA